MRRDTITDLDSTIYCIAIHAIVIVAVFQKHIGFSGINARLSQAWLNSVTVEVRGIPDRMVCHRFVVPCRMVHLHAMPGKAIESMSHFTITQRLMERHTSQLYKYCAPDQPI